MRIPKFMDIPDIALLSWATGGVCRVERMASCLLHWWLPVQCLCEDGSGDGIVWICSNVSSVIICLTFEIMSVSMYYFLDNDTVKG